MPRIARPTRTQLRRPGNLSREGPGDPLMKRTTPGSGVSGGGNFNQTGSAVTADNSTAETAATISLTPNSSYYMDARFVGRVTSEGGTFARGSSVTLQLLACVKRVDSGGTVVSGTTAGFDVTAEGVSGTPDFTASGNDVLITITGPNSDTIAWKVSVDYFLV